MSLYDVIYKDKFDLFKTDGIDDFADRLSFKFTCFILMIASTVIIIKQYFLLPISCYIASEPGGKYLISYMESYCWVEGTIPINFTEHFPTNEKEWEIVEEKKILYYQWVPFILALQALLCYIPQLLWRLFYINNNGQNMSHLISKANKAVIMDEDSRSKEVSHLARVLETILFENQTNENEKGSLIHQNLKKIYSCLILGKRLGAYLMVFYLFVKGLYLINAIGQLLLMQSFLSLDMKNYFFFGTKILSDIASGRDWEMTSIFPRIGYCIAKVRHIGSTNYVVAQCALPVNMLNEKLYIFLWFWMLLLSVVTSISTITWVYTLYSQFNKTAFLDKYLKMNNLFKYKKCNKIILRKFEKKFLQNNGLFILQMIASNSGDLITAEIVTELWKTYTRILFDKAKANLQHTSREPGSDSMIFKMKKTKRLSQCRPSLPNAPPLLENQPDL